MEHTTIEAIVEDLKQQIHPDDLDFLINGSGIDHVMGVSQVQRWIRNNYELWSINPLTERWRTDGPNDMRDGVDYSTDHPDNVSGRIYERFIAEMSQ